jgi:hypothetical protein
VSGNELDAKMETMAPRRGLSYVRVSWLERSPESGRPVRVAVMLPEEVLRLVREGRLDVRP